MYLFRGEFGTVLHTGDFRWELDSERAQLARRNLLDALGGERVDLLYLDNTYCHPFFSFPTREVAAQQVIKCFFLLSWFTCGDACCFRYILCSALCAFCLVSVSVFVFFLLSRSLTSWYDLYCILRKFLPFVLMFPGLVVMICWESISLRIIACLSYYFYIFGLVVMICCRSISLRIIACLNYR